MRISYIFALICLVCSMTLSAQNLEIIYMATVKKTLPEESRKIFSNDEMGRAQLKANEEPKPCDYKMIISEKESSFTYVEKINNDQDQSFDIRVAPAGFGTTYHNISDSTTRTNYDVYGKKYFSLDPLKKFDWKLTKETKNIMGYEVRKAIAEDEFAKYVAWYTSKIPISNGPAEFWGLPGLIIEIQKSSKEMDYKVWYSAQSITPSDKKLKIIKPNQGTQIKQEEIDGIFDKANELQNEMYNSQGVDKD